MMRRRGKVGARKQSEIEAAKNEWFERFGEKQEDSYLHRCQSCGRLLWRKQAEFSHKIPRCLGGDVKGHVQAENGVASCHWCHVWLESSRDRKKAREFLVHDPASMCNDLLVSWPPHLLRKLKAFLAQTTRSYSGAWR